MKVYLIRHGKTAGNLEKRYIGRTDQPLCAEGIAELSQKRYPACDAVVSSPMKRCTETAKLLFGCDKMLICDKLRECDFGRFEGHNYNELNGDPDYQAWIDSGGALPFPDGEAPDDFKRRCAEGFTEMTEQLKDCKAVAFVVHGGTIMSVLERFALPKVDYYDCMTDNGCGWAADWDGCALTGAEKL